MRFEQVDEDSGKGHQFRFGPDLTDIAMVCRFAADMWSDLAFDEATLARLKRGGLTLRGVRLTGPMPYRIAPAADGTTIVTLADWVGEPAHVDALLDLWRLHFVTALRHRGVAA